MATVTALAVWLVPMLVDVVLPERTAVVGTGVEATVPDGRPAMRFTPPAGWLEKEAADGLGSPFKYARGPADLMVFGARDVADLEVYGSRTLRLGEAETGITGVPAGTVRGPDGLAGPRWRLTGPDGREGELLVLGRDGSAAALIVLSPPGEPVDVAPIVDSLRTVTS